MLYTILFFHLILTLFLSLSFCLKSYRRVRGDVIGYDGEAVRARHTTGSHNI